MARFTYNEMISKWNIIYELTLRNKLYRNFLNFIISTKSCTSLYKKILKYMKTIKNMITS